MRWSGANIALVLLVAMGLLVLLLPLALPLLAAAPSGPGRLEALRTGLADSALQLYFLHSLGIALLACLLASLAALPLAATAVRSPRPVHWTIAVLGILPLTLPPFLGAALLDHFAAFYNTTAAAELLGTLRVRGSRAALVTVYAFHYFPLILFSLMAGLSRIDRAYAESARNLGAGRLAVWRRITLPLATPAYLAGATLLVLKVLEDVGTPLVLEVDGLLAPRLLQQLAQGGPGDAVRILAVALLGASLLVAVLGWSSLLPPPAAAARPGARRGRRAGILAALLATPAVLGLALVSLAPLAWLVLLALGAQWSDGPLPTGYRLSEARALLSGTPGSAPATLGFAAATGLVTLLIGLAAGIATLAHTPAARLVNVAATALFAIPGVVLALGYRQLAGLFDHPLAAGPGAAWAALVLVVALKQLPLAQRILLEPLRQLQAGALASARSIGASGPRLYWHIALPALGGALGAAFLLGAVAAALELSAVLVLIQDPAAPTARVLFDGIRRGGDAAAWATPGAVLAALTAGATLAGLVLLRRRCCPPAAAPVQVPGENA